MTLGDVFMKTLVAGVLLLLLLLASAGALLGQNDDDLTGLSAGLPATGVHDGARLHLERTATLEQLCDLMGPEGDAEAGER